LYLAYFLESRWQAITDVKNVLLPAVAPTLLFCLLIVKEPDLGTALACMAISTAVLYVAGMNMRYLWAGAIASLVPLYFLIVRVPWRWARMQAYLVQRPAGQRLPHHPIDDRRQHRRIDRTWPDGRQAETLLPA
jgi:cell division protein FtsW